MKSVGRENLLSRGSEIRSLAARASPCFADARSQESPVSLSDGLEKRSDSAEQHRPGRIRGLRRQRGKVDQTGERTDKTASDLLLWVNDSDAEKRPFDLE